MNGRDVDMGKGTGSVSIIGGADGPTSIFIARKGGKVKLTSGLAAIRRPGAYLF